MRHNFSRRWIQTSVLIAILLLSACGELAYKQGASATDLTVTKKTCQAKDSSTAAIEKCMTENGWVVQNLSAPEQIAAMQSESDPVIEASITEDNRQTTKPVINSKIPSVDAVNPTPENKKPASLMDTFKIGSWWKLGAGADNLKNSIQTCVTSLGEAHQPDTQTKKVTRGLLLCMKEKGWHGLREK